MLLRAYLVVTLKLAGTWRLPITKKVRCANLETFERVAARLNDQVTVPRAWRAIGAAAPVPAGAGPRPLSALRIADGAEVHRGRDE